MANIEYSKERKKLSDEEILYFYNILYEYEHDATHGGYRQDVFLQKLDKLVLLNDQYEKKANITVLNENDMEFTPYNANVCWAILYHIRNSIAHGNLYSTSDDRFFLIYDYSDKEKRTKCSMSGLVEKEKLYQMIQIIKDTRKL